MATIHEQGKQQSSRRLIQAASLADLDTAGTARAPSLKTALVPQAAPAAVPQTLKVSFFFDGTGNNLDADLGTEEHSNIARLFRAHSETSSAKGVFSYYLPGIGTRFKAIGDPGGETLSLGFGDRGDDRLDWAMKKLKQVLELSKGRKVLVALFGFSRGAALARAFARLVNDKCIGSKTGGWSFTHNGTAHPIRLYFMGLFDTVASVGMPMSTNNGQAIDLSSGLLSLEQALNSRHAYGSTLSNIAFAEGGAPGADPASGWADGHMAWADDLRIPAMVEDCVHMVAAHEIRNSFPLDSVLQGSGYPKSCREMVYPGAHSDVGGGYRLGEGARSTAAGSFLSLIPLRAMRAQAIKAGVPLEASSPLPLKQKDFGEDASSKTAFATLSRRFNHYMDTSGWGGKSVGGMMLSHMKLYYQWRLHKALLNQKSRGAGKPTADQTVLASYEPAWKKERNTLTQTTNRLKTETKEHRRTAWALQDSGAWMSKEGQKMYEKEVALANQTDDQYLAKKSLLDTLPGTDGSFVKNSRIYDAQLLSDVQILQALAKKKGRNKLRPHYRALLEAYEAEAAGKGLKDAEIIAFFDTYVHDSLAGFAGDATLPSDPRVVYTGGDDKLEYANNSKPSPRSIESALEASSQAT
ncbi:DUF2235 domain-containing protein [Corallococcus exiguus]|uniref:T6SS phospholipase effector Tle1-like catalytic domain-containing protein n=1 Tax=Corallococcus TaxID=83461 RepID=UPI0011C44F1C|nr:MULTISPECIES: DUF2235 domain-containing protein [Corallococcus]NNB97680.1 DUF2235 domain-containing protein [Corallococcus exiguus]NNC06667.1 DUF2235 domain-containing protein [Corallococcus exiguus]NPC46250.1 DUF2235 domain-containing protein [Corallococcus exiguus]